ncbi:hypothetical protein MAR_034193 [Mya arenaria]|uniref:Uncharacterized protein n=1 Tax=Mya arenaria TaxID=6604 RepID=A0ABY7GFF0_MYAAR|nr:hypothetical protein MAR_034193 [Mya arenaria]
MHDTVNVHVHDNNNQITKYVREEQTKQIPSGFKSRRGVGWHGELSDNKAVIKTHVVYFMNNCEIDAEVLIKNIWNFICHYQDSHDQCLSTSRCKTDPKYERSKYIIKI